MKTKRQSLSSWPLIVLLVWTAACGNSTNEKKEDGGTNTDTGSSSNSDSSDQSTEGTAGDTMNNTSEDTGSPTEDTGSNTSEDTGSPTEDTGSNTSEDTGSSQEDTGSSQEDTGSGTPDTSPPSGDGICGAATGQLFDASHPWNQAVDTASLDSESDAIINYLQNNHDHSQRFRIDGPSDEPNNTYGIVVLYDDGSAPKESFTPTGDFYTPDCDPAPMPVPANGAIEGEEEYACTNDGDCHHIVVDTAGCRLYEMWRAHIPPSGFQGGCQAVWNLTASYVPELRGDCCTSADAAGLPIAAHMFTADDIAAGEINHAIRFILPNGHMRERIYVRPATHSTGATSGPADAPPYGSRLRLRADYDESSLNSAAQVVARALKKYGMILSDGGNLTFTAANDRFTNNTWADVGLGPNDLTSLEWRNFEVVELGERFIWDNSCDCQRTPIEN